MEKLAENIFFTYDIKTALKDFRAKHLNNKFFILTDYNTRKFCLPVVQEVLKPYEIYTIAVGEVYKNISTAVELWRFLTKRLADRNSILVNLGGGVITDIGGFVASTFKRGIKFVNIPTSLLAQVDAAIGGKTGINLDYIKNEIGTFYQPYAVFIAPEFLKTLPNRHLIAGYAEVIKHALLSDEKNWQNVKNLAYSGEFTHQQFSEIIQFAAKFKIDIVQKDPNEKSYRKILNFGHTFGHAFETFLKLNGIDVLHGEAVAMGIICEIFLSNKKFIFDFQHVFEISEFISKLFPTYEIKYKDYEEIYRLMLHDKKNQNDQIHFTLLKKIGQPVVNQTVDKSDIYEALNFYSQIR